MTRRAETEVSQELLDDGEVLTRLDAGVFTITLNRPEAGNALSFGMLEALAAAVRFAAANPMVRCVVLRGTGKTFCVGGDIRKNDIALKDGQSIEDRIGWLQAIQHDTVGLLNAMPKPTLAVINGPTAGAGLSLALSCDLRLMSTSAFMLTAFASVGVSGDMGAAFFLSRLVGSGKAREMMFLSERVSATDAQALGLVNWCCEPADLTSRAAKLAGRLAAGPRQALACMKRSLNRAAGAVRSECLDEEAADQIRCMLTDDHREGVAAFFAKRQPDFVARPAPAKA